MHSTRYGQPIGEFLSIVKAYMSDIRQELDDEAILAQEELRVHQSIPQLAIVEIKSKNETIVKMEKDMKDIMNENRQLADIKAELLNLERKNTQKTQEIAILRDTIKTLYEENERIAAEKTSLSKEAAAAKQALSSLKKKYKRQEEQIGGYKGDLRKATEMAEERLDEYIKSDQQKQQQIKNLTAQIDKLKSEVSKKQKQLTATNKKNDELRDYQRAYQEATVQVQSIRQEKKTLTQELDLVRDRYHSEKRKLLEENENLLKQMEKMNEKVEKQAQDHRSATGGLTQLTEKCTQYEKQIVSRTEKIKQKNKQIKLFTEELNKMNSKVEELSRVAEQLMEENDTLRQNLQNSQGRNEQYRQFYQQLSRLKGQINSKKSSELSKLTESLQKLAKLNYI